MRTALVFGAGAAVAVVALFAAYVIAVRTGFVR
jgi:hypothetical protein